MGAMSTVSIAEFAADAGMGAVGIVFLVAFLGKVKEPREFISTVIAYRVLPRVLAVPFGAAVLVAEPAVAVSLLTRLGVSIGLALAVALLSSFAIAVGVNLYRERRVACGCFGDPDELISGQLLARLAVLLAVTIGVWLEQGAVGRVEWDVGPTLGYLACAVMLVAIGNWLLNLRELRILRADPPRRTATL